jgi:hypothetical protein
LDQAEAAPVPPLNFDGFIDETGCEDDGEMVLRIVEALKSDPRWVFMEIVARAGSKRRGG